MGLVEVRAGVQDLGTADEQVIARASGAEQTLGTHHATAARIGERDKEFVEDRHPHRHPGLDLIADEGLVGVDDGRRQLHPPVDRARMHDELVGAQAPFIDLIARGVLAQAGHEGLVHALVLHAQDVDDVGLVNAVERRRGVAAERLDVARQQGRRPAHGDVGAHPGEGEDVRPRDARVADVPDDPHVETVQGAEAAPQREYVQQRLGWVLVLAVTGVDHRRVRPAGDELRPLPAWGERITIAAGSYADSVCTVSLSDSPLSTLEPAERMLTTSAERRLAANSKELEVRVLAS